MKVTITKVDKHPEFLQTFADVTLDDGTVKKVSYCHKTLRFREDEVFNALLNQALAPPYTAPKPNPGVKPAPMDPKDVKPHVADPARVAKVAALKASFDKLKASERTITMPSAVVEKEVTK